ncbi:MAG: CoA transferase, partial [Gammaproteobacteria bacterium]|nr:CoA transferase [Gammaproteobacteria bacterium]
DPNRYHRGVNNTLPEGALGSQFLAMNKGKRSVSVDVHTELGTAVLKKLIAGADVFVSNYRASALTRMGLDLHELTAENPRLIVGHGNGFGPRGGDAEKAMLDGAAQARGGLASLSGPEGGTPMPPGAAVADTAGAMQLALACVTALVTRGMTGRGQLVQTSSLGAQLWLQMWELQHSALTGTPLLRAGSYHPNIPGPYGVYTTADDKHILFVTTMTDDAWASFWIFADKPEVILLEEWNSLGKRIGLSGSTAGVLEIRALMDDAFGSKTIAEWETYLASEPEIIWERVRRHDDVLTDPQNLENEYIVEIELPVTGATKTVGTLMAFSDTPTNQPGVPPPLGFHTTEIMTDLGFRLEEIESVTAHAEATRQEMLAGYFGEE